MNLPFRLTPHRHVDDRIETVVKRHGAFHSRVIMDPRKLVTREDYIQAVVDYVTAINQALARAQRIELSAGPTLVDEDHEESH